MRPRRGGARVELEAIPTEEQLPLVQGVAHLLVELHAPPLQPDRLEGLAPGREEAGAHEARDEERQRPDLGSGRR